MIEGLMKKVYEIQIKVITGWISSVDWDHIDWSEHFYCQLDHENKRGPLFGLAENSDSLNINKDVLSAW